MIRRIRVPPTTVVGRPARTQSGNRNRMLTAYSKCVRTCTSGAAIGSRADYYAVSPDRNPQGPEEGQRKASRGGSWRAPHQDFTMLGSFQHPAGIQIR